VVYYVRPFHIITDNTYNTNLKEAEPRGILIIKTKTAIDILSIAVFNKSQTLNSTNMQRF